MAGKTEQKSLGRITHYYSHLNVGIIELTDGDLSVGDTIHIKGKHTDFTQRVDSLQIEHLCGYIVKTGQGDRRTTFSATTSNQHVVHCAGAAKMTVWLLVYR